MRAPNLLSKFEMRFLLILFFLILMSAPWAHAESLCEQTVASVARSTPDEQSLRDELGRHMRRLGMSEVTIRKDLDEAFSPSMSRLFDSYAPGQPYMNQKGVLTHLPLIWLRTRDLSRAPEALIHSRQKVGNIVKWAPIWQNTQWQSAIEDAMIERIFSSWAWGDYSSILQWMIDNSSGERLKFLKGKAREWIEIHTHRFSISHRGSSGALSSVSLLPFEELPENFRRELTANWIDFEANPPLRLQTIKPLYVDSFYAGDCPQMFLGHMCSSLFPIFSETQKPTPPLPWDLQRLASEGPKFLTVRVGGHVIGTVKKIGDNSMLALRNVLDEKGRLILIAGGVYKLPRQVLRSPVSEMSDLNLPELQVRPNEFLFRIEDKALKMLWELGLGELFRREGEHLGFVRPYQISTIFGNVRALPLWRVILRKIKEAADRLERESEPGRPGYLAH